jgi:hypothetical protein
MCWVGCGQKPPLAPPSQEGDSFSCFEKFQEKTHEQILPWQAPWGHKGRCRRRRGCWPYSLTPATQASCYEKCMKTLLLRPHRPMSFLHIHDMPSTFSDQPSCHDSRDDHRELCSRREGNPPRPHRSTRYRSISSFAKNYCMDCKAQQQSEQSSEDEVSGFHA